MLTVSKKGKSPMAEVFQCPMEFPGWFIDYFDFLTWCIGVAVLAGVWVVFFRYGKFNYGIDLGCLWKSTLIVLITTAVIGVKQVVSVKFLAEHAQDGDVITLDGENLSYNYRNGKDKVFSLQDIVRVYKEPVTFNPPPKYYVVAETGGARDSIFVTENLPNYEKLLSRLTALSDVQLER